MMMTKRSTHAALLFGLMMTTTSSAWAQLVSEEADARFREGVHYAKVGKFEQARLSFTQAYAISADPATLWNLAAAEMKTGHSLDALRHFKSYMHGASTDPADLARAPKLLEQLQGETARVSIEAPAGAHLVVDGETLATTAPLGEALDVMPGVHTIEARIGAQSARSSITAPRGQIVVVKLSLDEPATVGPSLPPVADHSSAKANVTPPPAEPTPSSSTKWIVGGGAIGLGVVSAIVGIGFVAGANSAASDVTKLETQTPQGCAGTLASTSGCQARQSATDNKTRDSNMSVGFLAAAGALVGGGVVAMIFWPKASASNVGVAPMLSPQSAGAVLSGHF